MSIAEEALALHRQWKGKLEVKSKVAVKDKDALSMAYTPGVAAPCLAIAADREAVYRYTGKGNLVAVVTDGTAVLGLGDIGPEAALPVMEGKAVLFQEFAGVNAIPVCLDTTDVDEIVNAVAWMAPGFGGINLEDIASPRCVEIERRLKERLSIPVFHDDQHGTAIVVTAALDNALKVVGKQWSEVKIAVSGAGAAGAAIVRMLGNMGAGEIVVCASRGILNREETYENWVHQEVAEATNQAGIAGTLADAMQGADVFIGVSKKDLVTEEMVRSMGKDAIVFPMANPNPEILPDRAVAAGARIVGTGRSDFPNQINNVLAFPGVFRGALDVRASDINEEMKVAAALALAALIPEEERSETNIIPPAFDPRVSEAVARAVKEAAIRSGVARRLED
ncbi:MAG: NAD(P)-dependent malic enzyme [Oscillospiraceae bacterium]|jgi:malate dehydrogenase (oxaloacetate-decarboxylating)